MTQDDGLENGTVVNYVVQGQRTDNTWAVYDIINNPDQEAAMKIYGDWLKGRDFRGSKTLFRLLRRTAEITNEVIVSEVEEDKSDGDVPLDNR